MRSAIFFPKAATARALTGRVAAVDHDGFDLAGTAAPKRRGRVVFGRGEAGDTLLEGRKLDHYETVEFLWTFHDLVTAAARQHLAAELGDDRGHAIGVFLVFDGIVDLGPCHPIGRHARLLMLVILPKRNKS